MLNSLAPTNDYFEKNNMIKKHTYLNKFCEFVSNPIPFILVNGELSVCCRDYDGSLIMGDTKKDSIEAILNNERFKDLQHSHSNVNSNSFSNYNLCNSCFGIDERVSSIFINLIKMILYKFPKMNGEFYQQKINLIIDHFNEDIQKIDYKNLEKELFFEKKTNK